MEHNMKENAKKEKKNNIHVPSSALISLYIKYAVHYKTVSDV